MNRKKAQIITIIIGVLMVLSVVSHVVIVKVNSQIALQKLTFKMTETNVLASLGQPSYASDGFNADKTISARMLSYQFPFVWDSVLARLPGRFRYYNPASVTVIFLNGSKTISTIESNKAYQRDIMRVQAAETNN